MYLIYGWKIINENLLRGFLMMKQFLYSNLTDLIVKIVTTYILAAKLSLNGFWIGNMLGKLISVIICTFIIWHGNLLLQDLRYVNEANQIET